MNVRTRIRASVVAFGLLTVAAVTAGLGGHSARADVPTSFSMTASANSVEFIVNDASFPLLAPQVVGASPSTAQAQLDSFGGSTAFAGAPFLGQTEEGVGGLLNGLGNGVLPPIPATLPGYVLTSSPSVPTANANQGPYTLNAESSSLSSSATAGIAVTSQPSLLSTSATAITKTDSSGALESMAQSTTQPFGIGSVLEIGTVQAIATMSVDASGKKAQTSSFDLGTFTIAGIKVGLTQNGLQLANSVLPVPSLAILNTLLSTAGISLELLPGSKTATSITSEGLQINLKQNLPVEGATEVSIVIGQATAELNDQFVPPPANTQPTITAPTSTGSTNSEVPSSSSNDSSNGVVTQPAPITSPASVSNSPSGVTPNVGSEPLATAQFAGHLGPDGLNFYLILLLAGVALTVASRAAGALGIRRSSVGKPGSE